MVVYPPGTLPGVYPALYYPVLYTALLYMLPYGTTVLRGVPSPGCPEV